MTHADHAVPEDRLEEMVALWGASSGEEFRRRLVVGAPVMGNSHDAFEPLYLFRKFHQDHPGDAVQTAVLLLTDWRWRRATGRLVRDIEESGLVPDEHLDLLARAFVAAGEALYWALPAEWFDGPGLLLSGPATPEGTSPDPEEAPPAVMARRVQPPLRRWATVRLVRSDPSRWGALVQRAPELDARSGAAVMAGILEAVEVLPPHAQEAVVGLALEWGARPVRLAALEYLAGHGQTDRARKRARHDPDAAIRRWSRHASPRPSALPERAGGPKTKPSEPFTPQTPTLF